MSRKDAKELGEHLDDGDAALIVIAKFASPGAARQGAHARAEERRARNPGRRQGTREGTQRATQLVAVGPNHHGFGRRRSRLCSPDSDGVSHGPNGYPSSVEGENDHFECVFVGGPPRGRTQPRRRAGSRRRGGFRPPDRHRPMRIPRQRCATRVDRAHTARRCRATRPLSLERRGDRASPRVYRRGEDREASDALVHHGRAAELASDAPESDVCVTDCRHRLQAPTTCPPGCSSTHDGRSP
jgi:hypothetical protein